MLSLGSDARLEPRAPFCPAPSQAALGGASSSPSPASRIHEGFGRRPRLPGQQPPGPARPLRTKSCDRAAEARRCRGGGPAAAAARRPPGPPRAAGPPRGRASGRRRAPGRRRAAAEPGRGAPAGLEGHLRPLPRSRAAFGGGWRAAAPPPAAGRVPARAPRGSRWPRRSAAARSRPPRSPPPPAAAARSARGRAGGSATGRRRRGGRGAQPGGRGRAEAAAAAGSRVPLPLSRRGRWLRTGEAPRSPPASLW